MKLSAAIYEKWVLTENIAMLTGLSQRFGRACGTKSSERIPNLCEELPCYWLLTTWLCSGDLEAQSRACWLVLVLLITCLLYQDAGTTGIAAAAAV